MLTPEFIARINELAKKQRESVLTEAERTEQAQLRRQYIDNVKGQVKARLDSAQQPTHNHSCQCGCHDDKH